MTRFYVTHGTTRRSLRSGAEFAAARGRVSLAGVGVKLDHERLPKTDTDECALIAAAAKRARKAARRAGQVSA